MSEKPVEVDADVEAIARILGLKKTVALPA
jgi:hypothetical protein